MLGNESVLFYVFARNYIRGSKYNSWPLQYSVVVGLSECHEPVSGMKSGERALCQVRTSIWSPRRQLPARELCQIVVLTQDAMLSSWPPGNPQDVSLWKRHYTSTHSTTQHYLRVSQDTVQSTSRIPLSGRR